MRFKVMVVISAVACLILATIPESSASSTSGLMKEVVGNEKMQIYVIDLKEEYFDQPDKLVYVDIVLKNIGPDPRAFNPFFVKLIDGDGNERRASPLLGTVMPVRIPSNDILTGRLTFSMPADAEPSVLAWREFDDPGLEVDLTRSKSPPDQAPSSDWVLSSNKGRVFSDDRTELTIHDDRLNRSPTATFYLVDISIKNLGDAPVGYNALYAYVKGQEGNLYPTNLENLRLLPNPLIRGELEPGEEARGEILFLLPDTVSAVMFIYDERLGQGSYFVAPEFPYQAAVLIASLGSSILLARLVCGRISQST